jgi:hypothetical protein
MAPNYNQKKKELYTSPYAHEYQPTMGHAQAKFPSAWKEFKEELKPQMAGAYPKVDNRGGDKDTVFETANLRYDREYRTKGTHPNDLFFNYQVQANHKAPNPYLQGLAQGGNGARRAAPVMTPEYRTIGGSTVASVHFQTPPAMARPITPERAMYAIDHSQAQGQPMYCLDKQANINDIPAQIRQGGGVYHANPYAGFDNRQKKGSVWQGTSDAGQLPPQSRHYRGY